MDDQDTATVELTKGEAREVINALSGYRTTATGGEADWALDVREFLQREFGFEQRRVERDDSPVEILDDFFGTDDEEHEVQLSRAEAAEVVEALAESEADADPPETETLRRLRARFERTFDLPEPGSS